MAALGPGKEEVLGVSPQEGSFPAYPVLSHGLIVTADQLINFIIKYHCTLSHSVNIKCLLFHLFHLFFVYIPVDTNVCMCVFGELRGQASGDCSLLFPTMKQ